MQTAFRMSFLSVNGAPAGYKDEPVGISLVDWAELRKECNGLLVSGGSDCVAMLITVINLFLCFNEIDLFSALFASE